MKQIKTILIGGILTMNKKSWSKPQAFNLRLSSTKEESPTDQILSICKYCGEGFDPQSDHESSCTHQYVTNFPMLDENDFIEEPIQIPTSS